MSIRKNFHSLWKNISISDWIIFGFGLLFLIGFYFFFKRDTVYVTARFKITDENPLYAYSTPNIEYAHAFMPGDSQRDAFGRIITEIKKVDAYQTDPTHYVVYLDIRLKAVYDPKKHTYSAQGKDIVYGEVFTFSLNKVKFKALVVDFPGFTDPRSVQKSKTIVRAQMRADSRNYSDIYGIPNFLAQAIKVGDTASDSEGNVLVKVLDVTIEPAKRVVVNQNGQPFIVNDPELKDVYYTLEVATTKINGRLYMFDYMPVIIGAGVPINLKTVTLWPSITEIVQ